MYDDSEITQVTQLPVSQLERSSETRRGTLTLLLGSHVGAAFALDSQAVLIGRNVRAHVPLEDDGVSRNHARILHHGDNYELEDMGSTNGTLLDGVRIRGRVRLHEGARIQIGNCLLRFALQDALEWEASKRVYEASVRDGLTGVFNRRYFDERLISEFAYAARHGTALCALLIDIDHFKRINDGWGHPAGDHVLRRIGAELRAMARAEDLIARYGGEEFVVLIRGIAVHGSRVFAERLRTQIAHAAISWQDERLPVTASVGLAHNHSGPAATDPQRLVAAADKALYAAKAAGRNRVELAFSPGRYSVVQTETVDPGLLQPSQQPWRKSTAPVDESKSAQRGVLDIHRARPKKPPEG